MPTLFPHLNWSIIHRSNNLKTDVPCEIFQLLFAQTYNLNTLYQPTDELIKIVFYVSDVYVRGFCQILSVPFLTPPLLIFQTPFLFLGIQEFAVIRYLIQFLFLYEVNHLFLVQKNLCQ